MLSLVLQVRYATSSVQTRFVNATRQSNRTIFPTPQFITVTVVVVASIHARSMDARFVLQALVDVRFTVCSFEAWFTIARIVTNPINTDTVLARTTVALVDIDFTVLAHRTRNADALVSASIFERKLLREYGRQILGIVVQIVQRNVRSLQALSGVLARIGFALIDVLFAVFTSVARIALALVVVYLIYTLSTVGARVRITLVDVVLAVRSREAGLVAIAQEASQLIDTAASVLARCGLCVGKKERCC